MRCRNAGCENERQLGIDLCGTCRVITDIKIGQDLENDDLYNQPSQLDRIEAIQNKIADQSVKQADRYSRLVDAVIRLEGKVNKLLEGKRAANE